MQERQLCVPLNLRIQPRKQTLTLKTLLAQDQDLSLYPKRHGSFHFLVYSSIPYDPKPLAQRLEEEPFALEVVVESLALDPTLRIPKHKCSAAKRPKPQNR